MITVSGGPDWASIMTAFGTVGAVIAALGIALWSERRTDKRLAAERAHSDKQLADERAFSRAQIEEERQAVRAREQLAEAYAVQVVLGERPAPTESPEAGEPGPGDDLDGPLKRLAVMVVNRGSFTITRLEAQFSYDGRSLVPHAGYGRLSGFGNVPERLRRDWNPSSERAMYGILRPRDAGIRFESDQVHVRFLKSPYPVVRWTDQWGTRWEHNRGTVRQVQEGEQWAP